MFEVSLADLQNDEVAFRKFKLVTEDVQGKNCLTNFHGMDLTRDKMCSMVKKWQVMLYMTVACMDGIRLLMSWRIPSLKYILKNTNLLSQNAYFHVRFKAMFFCVLVLIQLRVKD